MKLRSLIGTALGGAFFLSVAYAVPSSAPGELMSPEVQESKLVNPGPVTSRAKLKKARPEAPEVGPEQKAAQEAALEVGALSRLIRKGAVVKRSFTVGDDLNGWLVDFAGSEDIYYTTADNQFLLLGALISGDGSNVSTLIKQRLSEIEDGLNTPKSQAKKATGQGVKNAMYAAIQKAPAITVGNGGKDIYAFFEPTCGFCARLHSLLLHENARVHYILVDFLSRDSASMAQALWGADEDDVAKMMDGLVMSNLAGAGFASWMDRNGASEADRNTTQKLKHNKQLMADAGATGTPAIVYLDGQGEVKVKHGLPSYVELKQIIGPVDTAKK